jgi:hypothetical protein
MPYDITLCAGGDCPIKNFCHRHTAEVLGRQDFFGTLPFNFSSKKCTYFLRNEAYFEYIRKKAFKIWELSDKSANNSTTNWEQAEEEFFSSL